MPKTLVHRVPDARCSQDVGGISEITILPDGRLYVLGLSQAVLEVLDQAGLWRELRPTVMLPRRDRSGNTQEVGET